MDGFLSVAEVCRLFNVSRETIRRWERDQGFPVRVRFSRHDRGRCGFHRTEVQAWIAVRSAARQDPLPSRD